MTTQIKFRRLKQLDLQETYVSLAIVGEYKRRRESQYRIKYIQIDNALERKLRNIIIRKIEQANSFEEYDFECPEPEEDLVRTIESESTDFFRIKEILESLNPEEDKIESLDELVKAKAYMIILRNNDSILTIGFKTIPENWKMKRDRGLIPLLFRENQFIDLEDENVFSIANTIDFIAYEDVLFILSKKNFEYGLNFREGMIAKADELYEEVGEINLFVNMDILRNRVGNNQRYLKKIATIKNLGYYRDLSFLQRFRAINQHKGWGIQFQDDGQIVITEEKLDDILSILQNKRLYSELTEEDFDVPSAKKI
jgi:hypothetical protein